MLFAMVPLISPSSNNRSRFRGVSSSVRCWSSHACVGGRLGCRAFVSNRRSVPKFFVRVNREMSLREKSETTFCVKTLFIKRPLLPFF